MWDAWTAKLAADAGFAALTVGSHPLADSVGKPDGEGMSFDDVLARVAQITAAVDLPVSVDIESGYGLSAAVFEGLLRVGAVGLNIEDTVHSEVLVDLAVARLTEAAQAGADVLYPVARHDPEDVAAVGN